MGMGYTMGEMMRGFVILASMLAGQPVFASEAPKARVVIVIAEQLDAGTSSAATPRSQTRSSGPATRSSPTR